MTAKNTATKPEAAWADFFEQEASVVYMLDASLRLRYCNRAWNEFAERNGGGDSLRRDRVMNRCLIDVIPAPLVQFYQSLFARALAEGQAVDHFYECSSADEERWFHMHVIRVGPAAGEQFLIVINSLAVYDFMDRPGLPYEAQRFRNEAGLITMCCHCRRVLDVGSESQWYWVPDLVREMPLHVSHGICRICFQLYYSEFLDTSTSAVPFGAQIAERSL